MSFLFLYGHFLPLSSSDSSETLTRRFRRQAGLEGSARAVSIVTFAPGSGDGAWAVTSPSSTVLRYSSLTPPSATGRAVIRYGTFSFSTAVRSASMLVERD